MKFPIYGKKHVPNHQPVLYWLVGIPRSCILIIPNIWRVVVYSPNSSSTSVLNTAHFCDSLGRDRRCLQKSCWVRSKREMPWFSIRIIAGSGCVISIPTSDESMNINESYPDTSGWSLTNHLEKYESQWEGLSYIENGKWKMFETTNQFLNNLLE